jgi:hypothetical protein
MWRYSSTITSNFTLALDVCDQVHAKNAFFLGVEELSGQSFGQETYRKETTWNVSCTVSY